MCGRGLVSACVLESGTYAGFYRAKQEREEREEREGVVERERYVMG